MNRKARHFKNNLLLHIKLINQVSVLNTVLIKKIDVYELFKYE